ncbi:MAG TPA: glycosyltransferase family 4 protein [Candidatus Binatia bacterium]|nr:glycosyltransferase family 4 protein [Candidatus Binatia bacterium]
MRIALVTQVLPHPADSGTRIRVARIVQALRPRHELTLLSLEPGDAGAAAASLGIPVAVHAARTRRRLAPVAFAPETTAAVRRAVSDWRADVVHLQGTFSAAAAGLDRARPVRAVLDDACVYHVSYQRAAEVASGALERARGRLRAWRLRRFERGLARRAAALVAVSEDEAAIMRALAPAVRVAVAPNGVDVDAVKATPPGDAVLFVGLLGYAPNQDAMQWFARDVLPSVDGAAEVLVAGRDPGPALETLARAQTRMRLLGFVPDLAPLYARAAVFVNPMRGGGGTRLKMLGAMAAGKAIVSTTVGAEGLGLTPERDVLIADTAPAFAAAVRALLEDRERAARLGRAARALVETRFRWEVCLAPLAELYASLERTGAGA